MAEPKTRPNKASVAKFIAAVADETKREDCRTLVGIMSAATGCKPVMWGDAIVGFGSKPLKYANGTELDWPVLAFSPRKQDLTIYIMPGFAKLQPQLKKLGKHKIGKVCLYVKRLSDIDLDVLKEIINRSC